eukprot:SM000139S00120  [mRNA]  locus=s139:186403:190850:+ [translate_table: standard]
MAAAPRMPVHIRQGGTAGAVDDPDATDESSSDDDHRRCGAAAGPAAAPAALPACRPPPSPSTSSSGSAYHPQSSFPLEHPAIRSASEGERGSTSDSDPDDWWGDLRRRLNGYGASTCSAFGGPFPMQRPLSGPSAKRPAPGGAPPSKAREIRGDAARCNFPTTVAAKTAGGTAGCTNGGSARTSDAHGAAAAALPAAKRQAALAAKTEPHAAGPATAKAACGEGLRAGGWDDFSNDLEPLQTDCSDFSALTEDSNLGGRWPDGPGGTTSALPAESWVIPGDVCLDERLLLDNFDAAEAFGSGAAVGDALALIGDIDDMLLLGDCAAAPPTGRDVMQAAPLQPDLARTSPDHDMAGWFFGGGAISQALAAVVLVKKGDGGARMPGRAFAISTLAVGTIACATGLCLHQLGMRQVKDWVLLGNMLRNNLRGTAVTHVPTEASGTRPAGGNAEERKSK